MNQQVDVRSVVQPTWQLLHHLAETSSLSDEGKKALGHVLELLAKRLGPAWPRRLFTKRGHLFPELVSFSSNVAVLPRLLALAVQLESVADDPTFAPVLTVLRRGPLVSEWQHARLQLEVARAARSMGCGATFEPDIPGSPRKGDLQLFLGNGRQILVETTTLFRSRDDLSADRFEHELRIHLGAIEHRHGVHTVVELVQQVDADEVADWLETVEAAARRVATTAQPAEVNGAVGVVRVQADPVPEGTVTFSGVSRERDAVRRLGTVVASKARQSRGPDPAWLRINADEGLFAFTAWSQMPPTDRISLLAEALKKYTADEPHLHGVICSSGAALALGATDPAVEDVDAENSNGFFIRRLLGPHLARETVIVRLQESGSEAATVWANAYRGEPTWLDQDLAEMGLPPLANYWAVPNTPADHGPNPS